MVKWSDTTVTDAERLADIGYFAYDLDTEELRWSANLYRIHELEPAADVSLYEELFANLHPDDSDRIQGLITTLRTDPGAIGPDGVEMQYRAFRRDGTIRYIRFHGRVEGRVWMGVCQDMSALREAEDALAAHLAVNEALGEWISFEEGAVGLLRRLATALECSFGAIWLLDREEDRLVGRAAWTGILREDDDFAAAVMDPGSQPVRGRETLQGLEACIEPDLTRVPDDRVPPFARPAGARSYMALPIVSDEPIGALALYGLDPRSSGAPLVRTLESLGRQLGRFFPLQAFDRRISPRELEVLRLAAEGLSGPKIAEQLVVSPLTVKNHFEHMYEKLGVGDRAAAVAYALRTGLIT